MALLWILPRTGASVQTLTQISADVLTVNGKTLLVQMFRSMPGLDFLVFWHHATRFLCVLFAFAQISHNHYRHIILSNFKLSDHINTWTLPVYKASPLAPHKCFVENECVAFRWMPDPSRWRELFPGLLNVKWISIDIARFKLLIFPLFILTKQITASSFLRQPFILVSLFQDGVTLASFMSCECQLACSNPRRCNKRAVAPMELCANPLFVWRWFSGVVH